MYSASESGCIVIHFWRGFSAARFRVQKNGNQKGEGGIEVGLPSIAQRTTLVLGSDWISYSSWDEAGGTHCLSRCAIFVLCWCRKDGYKVKETWSSEQWMKELHFTLSLIRGLIRAANDTWLNVCVYLSRPISSSLCYCAKTNLASGGMTHRAIDPSSTVAAAAATTTTTALARSTRLSTAAVECGLSFSDSVTVTDDSGGSRQHVRIYVCVYMSLQTK